jgi:hypothetical protein
MGNFAETNRKAMPPPLSGLAPQLSTILSTRTNQLRSPTSAARNIIELHKEMAFRVGMREGVANRAMELIGDKALAAATRDAIHGAGTDEEALAIARRAYFAEEQKLEVELKPTQAALARLSDPSTITTS